MEYVSLHNCDCIEGLKNLSDKSIDLIVTDPPYSIGTAGGGIMRQHRYLQAKMAKLKADKLNSGYDIRKFGEEFLRVLKSPNLYFWCNKLQLIDYFDFYVREKKCKFDILTWHKTNPPPFWSKKYLSDTEYLLYFHKGNCDPKSFHEAKSWFVSKKEQEEKKKYPHPTIKPLNIHETIIKNSSNEGCTVLDPFMGSGTTGVACKKLNRNFIGFEISPKYYQIAVERITNCYV